jgi:hypothetical protein
MTHPLATLQEMQAWAEGIMTRQPDVIIGENYLRRWWVIPRNPFCNVYLHDILGSDDGRALHDHPFTNTSFLIYGCYFEHTPEGMVVRSAGDVVSREASDSHRLEVIPGKRAISLFMTGPRVRQWGFDCPGGWINHERFAEQEGCGED